MASGAIVPAGELRTKKKRILEVIREHAHYKSPAVKTCVQIKAVNAPLTLLPASASLLSSRAPSSSVQAVWKLLSSGLLEGLPLWSFWNYTEMEVSKNVPGSLTLKCTLTWHVGGDSYAMLRALPSTKGELPSPSCWCSPTPCRPRGSCMFTPPGSWVQNVVPFPISCPQGVTLVGEGRAGGRM